MAQKTFVPGLRFVLKNAYHYGTRWQQNLHASLTVDQYNCLTSTLQAIASCLALLGVQVIEP